MGHGQDFWAGKDLRSARVTLTWPGGRGPRQGKLAGPSAEPGVAAYIGCSRAVLAGKVTLPVQGMQNADAHWCLEQSRLVFKVGKPAACFTARC